MTNKELLDKHGVTFSEGKFVSHMLLSNAGIRIDSFTIQWPGNKIDGKTVLRQTYTPRKKMQGWGNGEYTFMLADDHKNTFDTFEAFVEHYANK